MRPLIIVSHTCADKREKLTTLRDGIADIFDRDAKAHRDQPQGAAITFPNDLLDDVSVGLIVQVYAAFNGEGLSGSRRRGVGAELSMLLAGTFPGRHADCYLYNQSGDCLHHASKTAPATG